MSRSVRLLALAAAALLMVSCTSQMGEPETGATANPRIQPTPESAPEEFLERVPLESCGEFTLGLGEQIPATATECLENAVGASGAELVHTAPTDEGDPVVTWVRALPAGGMEIWSDFSEDKYAGEEKWQYDLCPSADSWPVLSGECTHQSFDEL